MKIICNKTEFAQIVRNCYKANGACGTCLLRDICDGENSVVAMVDVEEEREHPERQTCITCRWYRVSKHKTSDLVDKTCGRHTGLALVTSGTYCSYWEPVEIEKAGDTDDPLDAV